MRPTRQDPQYPFTNPQRARSAQRLALAAALGLVLAAPIPAHAGEGIREINHVCATQTGCFGGDAAGYPVTITTSGSYRLTNDLVVPDEDTTAIEVGESDVALDLAGFGIFRSGCRGGTADCTPTSGSGIGVNRSSTALQGLSVTNGTIAGMGSSGVVLGTSSRVSGVRVRWSRLYGILVGPGSVVSGSTVYENGYRGISAGDGSTVSGNTSHGNGSHGIFADEGSSVSDNTAYGNGGDGIQAGSGSTVRGNAAYQNEDDGIGTGSGCTVSDNSAYANGDNGIEAGSQSLVQRNNATSNADLGLFLGASAAYRENVVNGNGSGTVSGGLDLFSNSCNGTTTCP